MHTRQRNPPAALSAAVSLCSVAFRSVVANNVGLPLWRKEIHLTFIEISQTYEYNSNIKTESS